ncbi:Glucooligosaccharide oxidase [Calocera cornea HHB12733]|uniref:Glucooligosaccharide oxidase n=1 Tax=Calocera cornea HHB12733 TaxID=1353952 RepID=A0A165DCX3_9BASI|nr:Glucooligosaccharide oxidase [Calocera cornea HHB12733]
MTRSLVLLSLLAGLVSALPTNRADLDSCLSSSGASYLTSSSSGWDDAIAAYNQRYTYQPAAVAYPTSSAEAGAVVQCASAAGVPVTARSGGHSYAAYGLGGADGFLVVDTSKFARVIVDQDSGQAVVGTGLRLGDVAQQLYDSGERALPHGTCPYVGVGGHAAFGGYGFQSREWGLTLDRMIGATLVLANGTVAEVSATSYPDLFWAIRGSAPSFGIALSYIFATLPAPPTTTFFSYYFPSSASASQALLALQSFGLNADAKLGMEMVLGPGQWYFTGAYTGTSDELATAIAPLLDQLPATTSDSTVQELGWIDYLVAVGGEGTIDTTAPDTRDTFYAKSAVVPSTALLSTADVDAFISYLNTQGPASGTQWFVEAELYGGTPSAISQVPENATAYGNRDGLLTFQLYASSSNYAPPYPQAGFDFVDGMFAALDKHRAVPLDFYPNYVDDRLTDQQWQSGYYGPNYARLLRIKEEVDPTGVFAYPQAIGK